MKNRFLLSGYLFVIGVSIVVFLWLCLSDASEQFYDFERNESGILSLKKRWALSEQSHSIAGVNQTSVYLGDIHKPNLLIEVSLQDSVLLEHVIDVGEELSSSSITIDSGSFFVIDYLSFRLFRGTLEAMRGKLCNYDRSFFAEAIPIHARTVVKRCVDSTTRTYTLARQIEGEQIEVASGILERQIDGLFCTDGMTLYNKQLNLLVYIYYYRNQFIVLDTTLRVLAKANTIDPIDRAQIDVRQIRKERSIVLASPPFLVNRYSHTFDNLLFVHSKIKSRNDYQLLRTHSVIDIYELPTGLYRFSIYVPNFKGHPVKEFIVSKNLIVALQGDYLALYGFDSSAYSRSLRFKDPV